MSFLSGFNSENASKMDWDQSEAAVLSDSRSDEISTATLYEAGMSMSTLRNTTVFEGESDCNEAMGVGLAAQDAANVAEIRGYIRNLEEQIAGQKIQISDLTMGILAAGRGLWNIATDMRKHKESLVPDNFIMRVETVQKNLLSLLKKDAGSFLSEVTLDESTIHDQNNNVPFEDIPSSSKSGAAQRNSNPKVIPPLENRACHQQIGSDESEFPHSDSEVIQQDRQDQVFSTHSLSQRAVTRKRALEGMGSIGEVGPSGSDSEKRRHVITSPPKKRQGLDPGVDQEESAAQNDGIFVYNDVVSDALKKELLRIQLSLWKKNKERKKKDEVSKTKTVDECKKFFQKGSSALLYIDEQWRMICTEDASVKFCRQLVDKLIKNKKLEVEEMEEVLRQLVSYFNEIVDGNKRFLSVFPLHFSDSIMFEEGNCRNWNSMVLNGEATEFIRESLKKSGISEDMKNKVDPNRLGICTFCLVMKQYNTFQLHKQRHYVGEVINTCNICFKPHHTKEQLNKHVIKNCA